MTEYWRGIQRRLHEESALHYPKNKLRLILKAYVDGILNDYEENAQEFFEQGFLLTCTGRFLDERGNEMSMPRKQGKIAEGTVKFTLDHTAVSDLDIPKGTLIISSVTGYEYITLEKVKIVEGETEVIAKVQAIAHGKRYNAEIGDLTIVDTTYLSPNLSVTNEVEIRGGEDGESDAEYRQRLFNSISTKLTVNYLKKQGIILYSKKKYNNNVRIYMTSFNPYLNKEYCAIPPEGEMDFMQKEVIHNKIMQIYIKGW